MPLKMLILAANALWFVSVQIPSSNERKAKKYTGATEYDELVRHLK